LPPPEKGASVSSSNAEIAALRKRLEEVQSVDDMRTVLVELDRISVVADCGEEAVELAEQVLHRLRMFTATDPAVAAAVWVDAVLPRCLRPGDRWPSQGIYRLDSLLGEWLGALPETHRTVVREAAVQKVLADLDGPVEEHTLRVAEAIGYGAPELVQRLDETIRHREDEIGDHALTARCYLVPESPTPGWLQDELDRRVARDNNGYLRSAANAIGTPRTADLIWTHWIPGVDRQLDGHSTPIDPTLDVVIGVLIKIADRSQDTALAERVWRWLLAPARRKSTRHLFALSSCTGPGLNLATVVPDLLHAASSEEAHPRYLHYLRLLECVKPAHMRGWDAAEESSLRVVAADAARPSGVTGIQRTIEFDRKETAWEVLLCGGRRSLLPAFSAILADEKSGYAINDFLELASCIGLPELPAAVRQLLRGESPSPHWTEQELLVAQVAAIHAAHGSVDQGVFEALLHYKRVGKGVLLSLVDALADNVKERLGPADRMAVEQLFAAAEGAVLEDSREAAAGAVADLLRKGELTAAEIRRAAALAAAPLTGANARQELLLAFAEAPSALPEGLVEFAADLLDRLSDGEEGRARAGALAVVGRAPRAARENLLARYVRFSDSAFSDAQAPSAYVVGQCYEDEPSRFASEVATTVRGGGSRALSYLLEFIRRTRTRTPAAVVDALVDRLQRANEGTVFEPSLIAVLADVAPHRLVLDACKRSDAWLPQGRAELAKTLARPTGLPELADAARFDLLCRLMGDGQYAVRRAAYRSASVCAPEQTLGLVQSWAASQKDGEGTRRRAAECVGWLGDDARKSVDRLAWDPEPAVREAFRRSMEERSDRELAREHEAKVIDVQDPEDIIAAWKYGVALGRLGDDGTIDRLEKRLEERLAPSVRFWLIRVRKAAQRRWTDVTRRWPEPWFERRGGLETFVGVISTAAGDSRVAGTLWLMEPETPSGHGSWGGWADADGRVGLDEGRLAIPRRADARVLVTSTELMGGRVIFTGNGPYPALETAT
jgi:hypothetical protein